MSMNEEEIIEICRLICGTRNKKGQREYKTLERMDLLRDYSEDELEEAIERFVRPIPKRKRKKQKIEYRKSSNL